MLKNNSQDLIFQFKCLKEGKKLYPKLDSIRTKLEQFNTTMVKTMKDLTSH